MNPADYKEYEYRNSEAGHMHVRFMPQLMRFAEPLCPDTRILDVGCGNGFTCGEFLRRGCKVVGIDLSRSGIDIATRAHP